MRSTLFVLSLLLALPIYADPPQKILVLLPQGEGPINASTFLFSLSLQLDLYGIERREEYWEPPADLAQSIELARELGKKSESAAVLWYSPSADNKVTIYIADILGDKTLLRSLSVNARGGDAERSLALAARTLLRASVLEYATSLPADSSLSRLAKEGSPASDSQPTSLPGAPPAAELGFSLDTRSFPGGKAVHQGLTLSLSLPWREKYRAQLGLGARLPRAGEAQTLPFLITFYDLALSLQRTIYQQENKCLRLGPLGRFGLLRASAIQGAETQAVVLKELSLGAITTGGLALGPSASLSASLGLAWLPVSHRLLIAGEEVSRSGAIEILFSTGLQFSLSARD